MRQAQLGDDAPLLHSRTNRLVVAAEATDVLEKTDMYAPVFRQKAERWA